ncbi:MAG: PfkB family carbohydrate kinase [Vulcanimicrobiaceae bacterium]
MSVDGDIVVYDPQSPYAPEPFRASNRVARRLAIVTNGKEIRKLGGERDVEHAACRVLAREKAEVVVVKEGLRGALVCTSEGTLRVPAYQSQFAWTLGTGDLFAAVFAKFWAQEGLDPGMAADLASRAVALYAECRAIPPLDREGLYKNVAQPVVVHEGGAVYLAGPFFTLTQRWIIEESLRALRGLGIAVHSPLHDVGVGSADEVVRRDLELLDKSDRVFAILDGGDPGTLFEVGYARKQDIPVVAFAQNVREEDLKMVAGSECVVRDDFATAISAVLTV